MANPRTTLFLAVALLAVPLLTGCLGLGGEDEQGPAIQKQRANVDQSTGGIEGVVTDNAIQPIEGANLTLLESEQTAETASDGSFAFSNVQPGTYTVSLDAPGFITAQETLTVKANDVAIADFVVTPLVSEQPFTQQIEWTAFMECATGAGVNLSAAGGGSGGATLAACAVPNGPPLGNVTNDRFLKTTVLEAPIHTLVWEAVWDPSGNALGDNLWLTAEIQGFVNSGDPNATVYEDISTPSPFRAEIGPEKWGNISENFQTQCEEGNDAYCGYNFRDQGWPITIRTFTAFDCLGTPADACAPLQMEVNHIFSAFYNGPAPDGFSAFQGGAN